MYMNDFIRALDAFDMELDHIARNKNNNTIAIKYDTQYHVLAHATRMTMN